MVEPPLRIAHLIGALDFGGVENMALLLLGHLAREQFQHLVVYTGTHPPQRREEFVQAADGFETISYRRFRWLDFVLKLKRFLQQQRIDAVLCHNFGHHPWIGLAARWAGVQRIYTIVASSPCVHTKAKGKNRLKGFFGRLTCNLEIAVSPQVALELEKEIGLPPSRIRTIPNCCMTEEIAQRASARRSQRIDQTPSLLMAARMDETKDHPTLLQALSLLKKQGRPILLRLAGDGPMREEHERLAASMGLSAMVQFLGVRHDIPELLGEADVFILATKSEGFGIALIEAMSAGVPVIGSDVPACREVLGQGRCGLLVPVSDPSALAESILRLLDDPALAQRLIPAGLERVQQHYDPQSTIDQYARLLRGELDRPLEPYV